MQAVILAGGKGARLRPYTTILPKPLMPIGDKAILEIVLLQLKKAGFSELIFTIGYLGELLEAYFGNGSKWGVKIRYSRETEPLGTAGPLTLIDGLDREFLVMNGDILCDMDYKDLMKKHAAGKFGISICSYAKKVKIDLGVLQFKDKKLVDYIEKPEYEYKTGMGIYALNRAVVKEMPKAKHYDFPVLIKDKIKKGEPVGVYHFDGKWFDIGAVDDYQTAVDEFSKKPGCFLKGL